MAQQKGNLFKNFAHEGTKFEPSTIGIINNPDISESGLRAYLHLVSAEEGTHISVDSIMANINLSRLKTIKAIKELENAHLLKRLKKINKGRYEYTYIIFDTPYEEGQLNGEMYLS